MTGSDNIASNRKAFHEYFIEDRLEAGLQLLGWEVKAIRANSASITDAHILLKDGEMFVLGMHITPLLSTSTHFVADPTRTRKLLLHQKEISKLIGKVERAGCTLIPLNLHETRGRLKMSVGLAKGKKQYDKREVEKDRDWQREKARLFRQKNR